ncbi:MAG: YggS family pyridoxal phosphate-dependent enzyme [Ferruginibacter sp.]|nr:YggS family pyridoxal phosphate-dependent enzyme [Chitinophagaceae bacterium]
MPVNKEAYYLIKKELEAKEVTLVAVSKTRSADDILELYNLGQRDFGENYVQELVDKAARLPKDIHWHFIGHLQTNKVKLIAPFVQLIQGVDSLKLLKEISKQAKLSGRVLNCLLQVHIAQEETKFGLDEEEFTVLIKQYAGGQLPGVQINGLMGMASFTEDMEKVRKEFQQLKMLFDRLGTHDSRLTIHDSRLPTPDSRLRTLSMGMSSDYKIAIEEGSNMVRIGSLLFGERVKE